MQTYLYYGDDHNEVKQAALGVSRDAHPTDVQWLPLSEEGLHQLQMRSASHPLASEYRYFYLEGAEQLGRNRVGLANSFLKILEEPPMTSRIILIAKHTRNILPTILSRVQLFAVGQTQQSQVLDGALQAISKGAELYPILEKLQPYYQDIPWTDDLQRWCLSNSIQAEALTQLILTRSPLDICSLIILQNALQKETTKS